MSALAAGFLQELMPGNDATAYADDDARWSSLMASAQSGDEASYRQLLAEVSGVVNRYVVARFGHQDFVEDCVQEVLLAIHGARHTYDARRPFRPWLFAIVRHKVVDTLRQLGYRVSVNSPYRGVELVQRYSEPARGRQCM